MEIDSIRKSIDKIDDDIIKLLNERFIHTDEIGKQKIQSKINIVDKNREEFILEKIEYMSEKKNIEDIREIYNSIMSISKKRQNDV